MTNQCNIGRNNPIKVGKVHINGQFSNYGKLYCPANQRIFSWNEKLVEEFMDSLNNGNTLGNIWLMQFGRGVEEIHKIVDGHHRLILLYLVLATYEAISHENSLPDTTVESIFNTYFGIENEVDSNTMLLLRSRLKALKEGKQDISDILELTKSDVEKSGLNQNIIKAAKVIYRYMSGYDDIKIFYENLCYSSITLSEFGKNADYEVLFRIVNNNRKNTIGIDMIQNHLAAIAESNPTYDPNGEKVKKAMEIVNRIYPEQDNKHRTLYQSYVYTFTADSVSSGKNNENLYEVFVGVCNKQESSYRVFFNDYMDYLQCLLDNKCDFLLTKNESIRSICFALWLKGCLNKSNVYNFNVFFEMQSYLAKEGNSLKAINGWEVCSIIRNGDTSEIAHLRNSYIPFDKENFMFSTMGVINAVGQGSFDFIDNYNELIKAIIGCQFDAGKAKGPLIVYENYLRNKSDGEAKLLLDTNDIEADHAHPIERDSKNKSISIDHPIYNRLGNFTLLSESNNRSAKNMPLFDSDRELALEQIERVQNQSSFFNIVSTKDIGNPKRTPKGNKMESHYKGCLNLLITKEFYEDFRNSQGCFSDSEIFERTEKLAITIAKVFSCEKEKA